VFVTPECITRIRRERLEVWCDWQRFRANQAADDIPERTSTNWLTRFLAFHSSEK
jgi:hypothetical protein